VVDKNFDSYDHSFDFASVSCFVVPAGHGGWWNYYGITESYNRLRPLAHWIRRRLRAVIWKHWKNRRTRVRELLKRGVTRNYAVTTGCARKGPWRMSKVKWVNIALPDAYFPSLCLFVPLDLNLPGISRIAQYGPVCCVVWEGRPVRVAPIPIANNFCLFPVIHEAFLKV